jgi:hypothetical protein
MTTGTIILNLALSLGTTAIVGGAAFLIPLRLDRKAAPRRTRMATISNAHRREQRQAG